MNPFNEENSVEHLIRDVLCGKQQAGEVQLLEEVELLNSTQLAEPRAAYAADGTMRGTGWQFVPARHLPRQPQAVFVEEYLRAALLRLNPAIAAHPAHADTVLYHLRAIVLSVRADGLIATNERFTRWLRNEQSQPFGRDHEHVTVRLIDYDDLTNNQFTLTTQYTFRAGSVERRPDVVLLVNGLPLVIIEAKTPVRDAISWVDGALQLHDDYEQIIPELFACNVFNVATEGKALHYGAIGAPLDKWGPWRTDDGASLKSIKQTIESFLRPRIILDILANFTLFTTDKQHRRAKIVCRYQQYDAANKIVRRVVAGYPRNGLIWHFQGSGKSLLMVFAAQKLRLHPALKNPTVLIVVDRVDLNTQISGTFHASDIPNLVVTDSRAELEQLLRQDTRKIIITTIFKFGEADGQLNARDNIIVMVDEAHRTQEGDLGRKMRAALPNAFFFGLTGTPINKLDRNTFATFGAPDDSAGYLSRYGFEESIRDGATLPLHFEPRLLDLRIDKEAIDEAYRELTGSLSDLDRDELTRAASKMAVLLKVPSRVSQICADIATHFEHKVKPNGLKGMVVTYDQESCLLYKSHLDQHLPPEASTVVISVSSSHDAAYKQYRRSRDEEEQLLDRFRDPNDPLQLLIVTAKLLTGFDAPILQAMYLDKPLRDHTLLQAITRTNRTYGDQKTHGLIIDYLGVFDDVAKSLTFDEQGIRNAISNIAALKAQLPAALQACLAYFMGVDRTLVGYEGLIAAQEALPDDTTRDAFAADYSVLTRLWEAVSPDSMLAAYEADYRWLSQVYLSVQPSSGNGKLIWHALGAKTIELIHQNVHVEAVRDDLDEIVLDADMLDAVLGSPEPASKANEIAIQIARRLRGHTNDPRFRALSERLEDLKNRHQQGQLESVIFLKELLRLARDLVETERDVPPITPEERGKAALTELFEAVRGEDTPIIVERVVTDIDEIVRLVRFPSWQTTTAGEREVRRALRRTLFKYKLHAETELFEQAYEYVKQYY